MRYDRDVMPYDREALPYDRDMGYRGRPIGRPRSREADVGPGEYGEVYERPYIPYDAPFREPFHGYGMGYLGGSLRSRGSHEAGQIRSGLNPRDEFEFRWGEGYVGGRGYGGTNYDYEHGYRSGAAPRPERRPEPGRAGRVRAEPVPPRPERSPAGGRGEPRGVGPGEMPPEHIPGRIRGPARYGYGPYHDRLRRRRRSDEEIRDDVEAALFYDTWVDVDAIDIDVDDAVVTLRGTLPNFDEVRYATDDAWDVDGVRGVRTELEVEHTPVTDRLGRRREFTPGEIAAEHEAGAGAGTAAPSPAGKGAAEAGGRADAEQALAEGPAESTRREGESGESTAPESEGGRT